ncbi:CAP domain-containing protein [Parendozoicomonas sp. Alg238-R29]|uniref:CAP domain-containing protein n=1 Tax=Parendozoicomonas sp. Alg238-R29 TaxID=2993446 RepID=UPI00248E3F1B|nr:CAP domain-containing protein [Parendozoicomonas sp. Alg238-R29]
MGAVRSFVVLILLAVLPALSSADHGSQAALEFINKARAGLQPLRPHPLLTETAKNHSHYMALNNDRGHQEKEGYPGFTGKTCSDRMAFSGYPSRLYIENLSTGQSSWENSVQELMSAIYHRLGFLSFYLDEAGFAKAVSSNGIKPFYSYVMGYSGYRNFCEQGITGNLEGMCSDVNITVDESELYNIGYGAALGSADYVIYPWQGQRNVPPVFLNNEHPAPLPTSKNITGQPISVHFNPAKMSGKTITITRFVLTDDQEREVTLLPRLDKTSDINRVFTAYDFAWIPKQPLKTNAHYMVRLTAMIDHYPFSMSWSFYTAAKI